MYIFKFYDKFVKIEVLSHFDPISDQCESCEKKSKYSCSSRSSSMLQSRNDRDSRDPESEAAAVIAGSKLGNGRGRLSDL